MGFDPVIAGSIPAVPARKNRKGVTPLKNADYWRGRALILEGAAHKQGVDYATDLDREFKAASKRIQTEIESWYARFAANNEITLAEAKRWLTGRDLEEFRWTVQEYIKAGESLNPAFLKQLENASARVHISRLEALELQLQQQMEVLYGNHVDGLDKTLQGLYREGYYHTAFEIQRGFNLGWDLQGLSEKQIAAVLNRPWSTDGQTFRDRCWKNKAELINAVQTGLIQGFIRGDGPDKATKLIKERFRVSSNKAARLVMTESAYFAAQSQHDCYKDLDVGEFEVVETLDSHTCDICQGLDGAVFPMSDYEPGVTVPPFHPWCRGCTAPHFPDNYGERIARGADGKTYFVPSDMKYPEWYDAFVEGGSKADLTPSFKARATVKRSVLNKYQSSAKPGTGTISYDPGYKIETHQEEILTAEWLHKVFGGDITLLTESLKRGEKRADYLWRGKLWDLKSPTTEQAANTAIKRGLKQIKTNPGGIILNYGSIDFSMDDLQAVVDKRMAWIAEGMTVDIMVISRELPIAILRYTK